MPYVKTSDEKSLYYEVHGTGSPIVFIHPPAMGLVTFEKQLSLADKFKIVTFDLRGNGNSTLEEMSDVSMERISKDLNELLEQLQLDDAVICGYSNGCLLALDFTLRYPRKVKGLILVGAFSEVNSFLLTREFDIGILITKMKGINFLSYALGISHSKEKAFQKKIRDYVKQVDTKSLYNMYKNGKNYSCKDRLDEITCPIELVYGSRDFYIHHYQNDFEKNNKKISYVSGVGHQIPTRKFNELNMIITSFMENNRTKGEILNEKRQAKN